MTQVPLVIISHGKLLWDIYGKNAVFCFLCSILQFIFFFSFYIIVLILSQRPFVKLLCWWVNCHCTASLWAQKFIKKGTCQSETDVVCIYIKECKCYVSTKLVCFTNILYVNRTCEEAVPIFQGTGFWCLRSIVVIDIVPWFRFLMYSLDLQ